MQNASVFTDDVLAPAKQNIGQLITVLAQIIFSNISQGANCGNSLGKISNALLTFSAPFIIFTTADGMPDHRVADHDTDILRQRNVADFKSSTIEQHRVTRA